MGLVGFCMGCVSSNTSSSLNASSSLQIPKKTADRKLIMAWQHLQQKAPSAPPSARSAHSVLVAKTLPSASPKANPNQKYSLADLLQLALQRSPTMREAQYKLLSMKARQAEAFWVSWWPQGTLIGLVAPGPPARGDAVNTTTPQPEAFTRLAEYGVLTRVEFNLVWPLYTFGKLSLLQDAAKEGVKIGESNIELERSKWALLVKQVYYGLQLAESSLELLDEAEEQIEEAKKKVKGATDKLKIQVIEAEVKARRVQADSGKKLARSSLSRITGVSKAFKLAQSDLQEPTFSVDALEYYQKLAKQHRPELKLLDHAIRAKKALLRIQQRMWLPDLFIAAFFRYGYSSAADDQLSPFARDDFNFLESGVMLGLRFAFDFPIKIAQTQRAEADFAAFQSRRDLAFHGIQLQIEKHHNELKAAKELVKIQEQGRAAANKWMTRAMIAFTSGLGEVREVSDALLAVAKMRFSYLQAVHQSWVSAAELSRAVGVDITQPTKKQKK